MVGATVSIQCSECGQMTQIPAAVLGMVQASVEEDDEVYFVCGNCSNLGGKNERLVEIEARGVPNLASN